MTKSMLYINCLLCIVNLIVSTGEASLPKKAPTEKDDEFFTAAADMNLLLKVELKLGRGLLRYIEKQSKKLAEIEMELDKIDRQHAGGTALWVSQPTSAYNLLKRFTEFWPSFGKTAKHDKIRKSLSYDLVSLEGAYPSENDLRGALAAITRIQRTYNISAREFISGLNPVSHKLDVQEIFQMGFLWSELGEHFYSREWLLEAVKDFPKNQTYVGFLDKSSLYEYLAWAEYMMLNVRGAIRQTKNVLKINPRHQAARANLKIFNEYAKKQKEERKENTKREAETKKKNVSKGSAKTSSTTGIKKKNVTWHTGKHHALCRGDLKMRKSDREKLYCFYKIPRAQFIIKPWKVEYLYHDPNITLYHNFVSEWEMEYLKDRSTPYLRRATVHDVRTGKLSFADYRVSKSAWIKPERDAVVSRIYQRVSHVTGLDRRSFEPLQIANYGMAGQYEPHYDHFTLKKPMAFNRYGGNRLATLLIYMSDVERGGWTVFTKTAPGVVITPAKGSAAFWYNLKRNGKGDNKTEHAACPVILGQKWISNIWIHERHQEFHRPCSLNKHE